MDSPLLKLWVVRKYIYPSDYFDEVMDGIVYMVGASLGFACFENILYVLENGLKVAIVRSFTVVPLHAFALGLMGFYLSKAKFATSKKEETALISLDF